MRQNLKNGSPKTYSKCRIRVFQQLWTENPIHGCKVFVIWGIRINVSAKLEAKNNMEAPKAETNEVSDPILEHES